MKISELIQKLQELQAQHGDITVLREYDAMYMEIESVEYSEESNELGNSYPEHVAII